MVGCHTTQPEQSERLPVFATTHWSVVLATADEQSAQSTTALEQLCRTYWYPLYAYVRRCGNAPEDAEDLTQEFFLRLLRKHYLSQVDPSKGRFRSFLLAAMNHLMANEWDRGKALKRGGNVIFLPLDLDSAEQRLSEASWERSPEQLFERCWALTFLQEVLGRLRAELALAGHVGNFDELKIFLTGDKPPESYAGLAAKLGATQAALRKEVERLRHRYGELLREEMTRTVANPADVEDELCHLFTVLSD